MITDMTKGKIGKTLLAFTIPLLLSVMFQQMYNIMDSVIAGRILGESVLAAVGNSYEVTLIFMSFAVGCNIGCSVIISQLFGAKRMTEMKTAVNTTFISCTVLSVVMIIIGLFCLPMLLKLINTPDDIYADSYKYMSIYIYGVVFVMLYNICNGVYTALGDSKMPLTFLIFSSVTNIILDYCFLKYLKMGVEGVAWATFIAQGVAFILAIITLFRKLSSIETLQKPKPFSWYILKKITVVAVPSIIQQGSISVGNIFIQSFINSFGAPVIAGYASAIKFNDFVIASFATLANGVSSFSAQNIGAGMYDRVESGRKSALMIAWIAVIPFLAAYLIFAPSCIKLFVENPTPLALKSGSMFLRIVPPFYFLVITKLVTDGVLRGSGAMKYFMISTFTDLFLRVILGFVFSKIWDQTGIWFAWPVGWIIGMVLSVMFYKKGVWKVKSIV